MKSILQEEKVCYISGSTIGLHKHHVFEGRNRSNSEKHGLWIWLRYDLHNLSNKGVHFDKEFDTKLKKLAQEKFEETHSREEFMNIFKRNYL